MPISERCGYPNLQPLAKRGVFLYCSHIVKKRQMAKPTETTYRVIAFGDYEHGFYNRPLFVSNKQAAYNEYQNFIADPEVDGCVLIEVQHENWRVIEEFGTEDTSVIYGPLGNFKVAKAPKLVMV